MPRTELIVLGECTNSAHNLRALKLAHSINNDNNAGNWVKL
ncbi:hypothetical protein QUF07_04745 [Lentilactobacillus sp. TOM.63]|nr:hypothetical protein [Lentilactobacillus sp. TOM.63]MDM7516016.1 hypothetical protein [Lentilactobacillus sp. TOM.63]